MFARGSRLVVGSRVFIPVGAPKRIGDDPPRGFAKVNELGATRTITLAVGRNKGVEEKNQTAKCARKPREFSVQAVDEIFESSRRSQVGVGAVGATRQATKGWYRGEPEKSVTYQVTYIPNAKEKSFRVFKANMDRLAETLAERFCQDSVLILRDDGRKRSTAEATWGKKHKKGGRK